MHKKRLNARAKLLFCHSKPIVFLPFSLLSPSSLLKLPIVVNQKFCYHGNVTAHFSSLLDRAKRQAYSNDVCDHVLMTPLLLKERELSARMFYLPSKTRKWNQRISLPDGRFYIMHQSFSLILWLSEELYQTLDTVFGWSVGSICDVLSVPVLERGLISRTATGYWA